MKTNTLLTRDQFRESCLIRDNHCCVICQSKDKLSVHHIIERRCWEDGGYYMNNGATLCEFHHIKAEETTLTCDEIRSKVGITEILLPDHLYGDQEYDKWGNIILPSGQRLKGDLFNDESVQKILQQGNVLNNFSNYVKYPRTYHLPWSVMGKDDRQMKDDECFIGKEVVATLKMDGENTSMYRDYIHARSLNSNSHPTRNWVKGLWSQINYLIDENMRVCGENLYALHTVKYDDLPSYFMTFSIWIDNICLSWDDTVEYSKILGLEHVPVIYRGIYTKYIHNIFLKEYGATHEGYVIRLADEFKYGDFRKSIGKYVKPEFRQAINNSHGHWISKKIEKNELKKANN